MPQCHRIDDANYAGGVVSSSLQSTVYANNILISVDGSPVTPHPPFISPHTGTVTANGSTTVFAENININRKGDADSCGHPRAEGSPNVFVG